MFAIPRLPARGSDASVLVTRVHLHPLCVLVEFWGKFCQERATDYEILAEEIQSHGALFKDLEGNPGDQCLVHIDVTWFRARIVSRDGSKYSVFLIDRGMTYTATANKLAWGKKEHFQLPPEVELCILANVLPLSSENRWSPVALEFLKSLTGRVFDAHVQDVLLSDRMFLLDIPCISRQMYEMGFAKKLSPVTFENFLHTSLKSSSGPKVLTEVQQPFLGLGEKLQKQELFMYPEIPGGTVETVVVTEVTNPQQIFCQLKVFSHEIKKLTEKVTQSCEGNVSSCLINPDMIEYPCAARGMDGRWYRSIIQQVFPTDKVVEVLNVDYGTKHFVKMEHVRPLTAEFTKMPVVTYICSLHGLIDKRVGWTTSEIDFLKSLLIHKTVIAKVEYKSVSDQLYYVTLYGDDNINMNSLFGSKVNCFPKYEKTVGDYALPTVAFTQQHPAQPERKMLPSQHNVKEKEEIPVEELTLNSSHLAAVQHILDPSEFWIQTENFKKDLEQLLDAMYHLYQGSQNTHLEKNPALGLYCAAQAEDGEFYRATVTDVGETQIKVFFVDYGNTEMVEKSKIRILPPEFKKMPQLGLKCSLAGVRAKDGQWSQSALEYFIKAITDKALCVHVKGKYCGSYVVQLTDPKVQGQQDVGTQMCSNGLAERTEIARDASITDAMKPSIISPTPLTEAGVPSVHSDSGTSFKPLFGLSNNERRVGTFKEQMFPIGSVLDVNVSCIESPNDFWCQLVQNAGPLRLLMHDMQAFYANSEFEPNLEPACVARHPDNGMWYRALVVRKHKTTQVDVLFVDYGQTKTISLFDLRKISPDFLALKGQAFRCSLLNLLSPTSAINEWNDKAKERFRHFVESAASSFIILKCTVYAIMYSEQMVLHNIVDLETPFESICTSLANLVTNIPPKKATGPSLRLDTYYYSTHNIKTGTEEQVTVALVNSVGEFYCHLDKNIDVMKDLTMRVNNLCQQLEKVKPPPVFGTLCFARYTDGQWYRAQIKATKPELQVYFVDYGDTLQVDKTDLLPVPKEASDIMSVPVQAVVCALSDVPANVPSEANEWFEKTATECQFRALIVAREDDGKLLVELYQGHTQINAMIKKTFQIEKKGEQVVYQRWKSQEAPSFHPPKMERISPNRLTDSKDYEQAPKKNYTPKPPCPMKTDDKSTANLRSPLKFTTQKHKLSQELYKPPFQRQPNKILTNDGTEKSSGSLKPKKANLPLEPEQFVSESGTQSYEERKVKNLPKLTNLPTKCITPGAVADVYISHCDSPLSFHVQHVNEEDKIFCLVEELNNPDSPPNPNSIKEVHLGDIVKAEFPDDSSWYRAVVKEPLKNAMALVEFIDYGNTAVIPVSKMERLPESSLLLPVYSTHCTLGDATVLSEEKVLEPNVVSAFKEDIGSCGVKVFKCQFIKQLGFVWEVNLEDAGKNIMCQVSTEDNDDNLKKLVNEQQVQLLEANSEKPLQPWTLGYPRQIEVPEGQQLGVYITTINEDQTFWCQSADSQELCEITSCVSECGNAVGEHNNQDVFHLGKPCVALFADDLLWYRAEVVDKNDKELSVLFVDYGNKSQVNIADVRAVPPALLEVPTQAFLCELEGFDASRGFWGDGAVDELSTLTADKLLQLTVTNITRTDRKLKYVVEMECEGQVINKAMNTYWICKETVNTPDSGDFAMPQKVDSTDAAQNILDNLEVANNVTCTTSQNEEHSAEELIPFPIEQKASNVVTIPKHSEGSEDSNNVESVCESGKEDDSSEETTLPGAMISPGDILPSDSSIEEPSVDLEEGILCLSKNMIALTGQDPKENNSLVLPIEEPSVDHPLRNDTVVAIDGLETETSVKKTFSTSTSRLDMDTFNDSSTVTDERDVAPLQADLVTCPSEADVDFQEDALKETTHTALDSFKQAKAAPSSPIALMPLCEQETEAGDGHLVEVETCVSTNVKNDTARKEAASAHHVEALPALLEETATAISEEHSITVPSAKTDEDLDECLYSLEVAHLAEESSCDEKTSADEDSLAEEMTPCITVSQVEVGPLTKGQDVCDKTAATEDSNEVQEDPAEGPPGSPAAIADVPHNDEELLSPSPDRDMFEDQTDPINISPADGESQIYTDIRNVVEELTCLVENVHSTDASQDSEREAEMETGCRSEQTSLPLNEVQEDPAEGPPGSPTAIADVPHNDEEPSSPSPDRDTFEDQTDPIKRNVVEEPTCFVENVHSADVSQDSEQEAEMETGCRSEETPSPLNEDSSASEEQTDPINVSSAEVETFFVEDVHSADVSQDSEREAEMETGCRSEQTPSPLNEDFNDAALTEESLSAEDSYEAELSKIVHLSLIVKDGAAVFPEQQPEE